MTEPRICPACGAAADQQIRWRWIDGEDCWCCPFCSCVYEAEDPTSWLNLTDEILDSQPNDGWDGAAGAELRDQHYEAYPHFWDYTLNWCRVSAALKSEMHHELFTRDRHVEDIPAWIVRRALVALPERWRRKEVW